MKTINEIFDSYFAGQAELAREWHARAKARKQAWAQHEANLHTCGNPPPAVIEGWYSTEQYKADSAAGRLTD